MITLQIVPTQIALQMIHQIAVVVLLKQTKQPHSLMI